MKEKPVVVQGELQVRIRREDYDEFGTIVRAKEPPEWLPAIYRMTKLEDTGYIPASEPWMIVRVMYQYVGQTKT
jgi:hypothetical protein